MLAFLALLETPEKLEQMAPLALRDLVDHVALLVTRAMLDLMAKTARTEVLEMQEKPEPLVFQGRLVMQDNRAHPARLVR